jgi:hypothetical protein
MYKGKKREVKLDDRTVLDYLGIRVWVDSGLLAR